ncbi:hypothetical protein DFH06DRAFT_1337077 [Mycena polygramma]|nr:hypothetical protein DFH06DRAFT_1337077 [Mycena polygramma]
MNDDSLVHHLLSILSDPSPHDVETLERVRAQLIMIRQREERELQKEEQRRRRLFCSWQHRRGMGGHAKK